MNAHEKLQLQKLIAANDSIDTTERIRQVKHSTKIKDDVELLVRLKLQYIDNIDLLKEVAMQKCHFLYNHYTDIYHKIMNDNLNMNIFEQFLNVLHDIENGEIDQHEGSYKVGQLLKQIYIDSAIQEGNKHADSQPKMLNKGSQISWREYSLRSNT